MSRLSNARTELENYEKTRPADYVSQYQPKIKDVMGQLDGMKEFDYDPDADTAYQQYKSQYTRSAKLANQNAQANAAAQTGGYGSSYGTQAGQNAYTATMNNLDNVLNSLQDQSRSEYTAKRTGLESQLSGLQNAEQQDYQNYQKDKMAALLQGASLAGSGNDTAAKNYLQMAGLSGDSTDSYGTIAGRLNSSNLAYQQALLGLQQRYKTTGTGSTRSGGSSSGSKSGGYTTSQLQQMANKFSSMKGTEPLYDFYKRTLTNAGWIKADIGTKASTQSAAGGTGAGKAGTTTSKLPAATTKTPWSASGTVDGVAGASVSMASPKGGNYNTALREAQQMANNGYDMAQITEYLIRKNYSDSTISQVSQTMGW